MKMDNRDKNPISQSLKDYLKDQFYRGTKKSDWETKTITGSEPFSGEVQPGKYGAVGDGKKKYK